MQKLKSIKKFRVNALLVCAIMLTGCSQESSAPLVVKVQDSTLNVEQNSNISINDLMKTAEEVLAGMYFTIEKADVENGIIRTRPLPGAQFFEFWRSDNVGADNTLAANIHTIRRTVTLNLTQQKPSGDDQRHNELNISCDVHVQRLSLPTRQVNSSARVYGMFSRSSPSLQRLQLNPQQKKQTEWIDLGRDPKLETEILKQIVAQILRQTNHKLQTTENQT